MKQDRVIAFALVVFVGIGTAILAAPPQRGFTGTPADIINVKVTNKPTEPVAAVITDLALPPDHRPLRIDVTGRPNVTIDPSTTVKVELRRQQWEYKQVRVSLEDAASILTSEGAQGWETTGTTFSTPGGTFLVLKRIK